MKGNHQKPEQKNNTTSTFSSSSCRFNNECVDLPGAHLASPCVPRFSPLNAPASIVPKCVPKEKKNTTTGATETKLC